MKRSTDKKGFTLIEVVLVLAIGGLIFLLAFLAFQQVSRNRRDSQRRSDASRIVAEVSNYSSDNQGALPAASAATDTCATTTAGSFGQFLATYMCSGGAFNGPQGAYTVIASATGGMTSAAAKDSIMFTPNYTCAGASTGNVRVQIKLEAGIVCRDDR